MREKHDSGRHYILALVVYVLLSTLCFATLRSTLMENADDLAGSLANSYAYEMESNNRTYETLLSFTVESIDERIADEDRTILFQSVGSSLTSGEQIDMFCHVQRGRLDVSRCRLKAAICGYDREERPVFSAVLIDLDGENDGDDCIFENRAEVAHIG